MRIRPVYTSHGFYVCLAVVIAGLFPASALAQDRADRAALKRMELHHSASYRASVARLDSLLQAVGGRRITTNERGLYREWIGIRDGRPVMYQTHNREAAASAGITYLHSGGVSGLELSGNGQRIGFWDAGRAREDHVEFGNRVTQHDDFAPVHVHSTHVTGTLAAAGTWIEAKGMAPLALVDAHDWNNDVAEMASAAAGGLIVSNHSYGEPLGWTPDIRGDGLWGWMGDPSLSGSEDIRFGFYTQGAAAWDELAFNAPELVIVKSAGNERERQGPLDGEPHYVFNSGWIITNDVRQRDGGASGYDSIGDASVAKNVLTVGAVEDAPWGVTSPEDVVMTSFSGWGPTDDGRIKPDLVANGVELLSAKDSSSDAYGTSSGTSMAAPVVTGAVSLMQELFAREFGGATPLSSTMRALLIHTADEAGTDPGPDYRFGWGHLNAERAAWHIRQTAIADRSSAPLRPFPTQIIESEIGPGESFALEVSISNRSPLRVTLAWTDPAGIVRDWALNERSPEIVHDLDIEIVGPTTTHLPWTLDPATPAAGASRAKNSRDNVEQVFFEAEPGAYTVLVHAPVGLTTSKQAFSLIVGEAQINRGAREAFAVSGTIRLGSLGIKDLNVRVEGPVNRGSRTSPDGVFFVDDLPAGEYRITPDPSIFIFDPPFFEVTLPGENNRFDLNPIPPLVHVRTRVFESSLLLQSGEQGAAIEIETPSAGGVYGVELFFSTGRPNDLQGSDVVLDTRFDPFVSPFSGSDALRLGNLTLNEQLRLTSTGELKKRVPVLWFSGDAPEGHVVRIPYQIRSSPSDQLLYADTLRTQIRGRDHIPPFPITSFRAAGASFALPGESLQIQAGFLDGSRVTSARAFMLDRFDQSRILDEVTLRDSGNLEADLDFLRGDGVYSGRFFPTIEADYRISLVARDEHGNELTQLMNAYYSSVSFDERGDILFLGEWESGSKTETHLASFRRLGVFASWWESLTRGRIPAASLASFEHLIVGRHGLPIQTEIELRELDSHLDRGGTMMILGQVPVRGSLATEWLFNRTQLRSEDGPKLDGITGIGDMYGFRSRLFDGARPQTLTLPALAQPVLMSSDLVLAARVGQTLVSTVSAASIPSLEDRDALMSGLLFAQTGDASYIDVPDPVLVRSPADTTATTDFMQLGWALPSFAYFELQWSEDSSFASSVETQISDEGVIEIGPLERDRTFYWRVRAINPAGESPFSLTRIVRSRPINRAPSAFSTNLNIESGTGKEATTIDLSGIFSDPDSDSLSFAITVSQPNIVEITQIEDQLELLPLVAGETTLGITALDPFGLSASVEINVLITANNAPTSVGWPGNPFYILPATTREWTIEELFEDADGDSLFFWSFNADSSVAVVTVNATNMTIESKEAGEAFIAVTISDARGGSIAKTLVVRVRENEAPIAREDAPRPELLIGESSGFLLTPYFLDPDEDRLTFQLLSASEGVGNARIDGDSLFASFDAPGQAVFTLEAQDPFGLVVAATLVVDVRTDAVIRFDGDKNLPRSFSVGPNFPQPFSSSTTIPIALPARARVTLQIYDSLGRLHATIIDRVIEPGRHRLEWVPRSLPSGTYYFRMRLGNKERFGMLVYVK